MTELDDLPPYLYVADRKDETIAYIFNLPIAAINKKYLFIQWCKQVNIPFTGFDIGRVTGHPPGSFL